MIITKRGKGKKGKTYKDRVIKGKWQHLITGVEGLVLRVSNKTTKKEVSNAKPIVKNKKAVAKKKITAKNTKKSTTKKKAAVSKKTTNKKAKKSADKVTTADGR